MSKKRKSAYQKLFEHFDGSKSAMAKAFGINRQAIDYWEEHGVPTKRAKQAEIATGGAVSAIEILEG